MKQQNATTTAIFCSRRLPAGTMRAALRSRQRPQSGKMLDVSKRTLRNLHVLLVSRTWEIDHGYEQCSFRRRNENSVFLLNSRGIHLYLDAVEWSPSLGSQPSGAAAFARNADSDPMALRFPNLSRSYDATRRAVRFWGYDSAMEASFFVTEHALKRFRPDMAFDQASALQAFDVNRSLIYATAAKVYARGRKGSYDLVSGDF